MDPKFPSIWVTCYNSSIQSICEPTGHPEICTFFRFVSLTLCFTWQLGVLTYWAFSPPFSKLWFSNSLLSLVTSSLHLNFQRYDMDLSTKPIKVLWISICLSVHTRHLKLHSSNIWREWASILSKVDLSQKLISVESWSQWKVDLSWWLMMTDCWKMI